MTVFKRVRIAIVDSIFSKNVAARMGGAMVLSGTGGSQIEYILRNVELSGNSANTGGAICMPSGNDGGAALSLVGGTRLSSNTAQDKVRGGALACMLPKRMCS